MGRLRPKDLGRFHNLAWVSLLQAQRRQSENASLWPETKLWGDGKQQRAWETLEEDPPPLTADETRWAAVVSWAVREQAVQWCDLERREEGFVCVYVCVFGFFWVTFSFYNRLSNWHNDSQELREKAKRLSVSWQQDASTSLLAVRSSSAVHAEEDVGTGRDTFPSSSLVRVFTLLT